jgi:hypothetical protein
MSRPDLWIEAHHYGRRVLARNVEPWLKPAELGLFYRQLADLSRPQLIELPLLALMRAHLANTLVAVADSQEAVAGIVTALRAAPFSEALHEGSSAVAGAGVRCMVAFALPGPDALLAALTPNAAAGVGDDERDILAIALTDLVRMLARISLPRLMLHENSAAALAACDVIFNVTRDYRVPVTLITDRPAAEIPVGVESVMAANATAVLWRAGQPCRILDQRLWESPEEVDCTALKDAQVARIVVPLHAAPEIVMQALARLHKIH